MPAAKTSMSISGVSGGVRVRLLLVLLQLTVGTRVCASGFGTENVNINSSTSAIYRRVPAMFIFGDSTVDNGNNNKLDTIARANFPPYGRDFDTRHATGRFSNGRVASDFVAEFVRLPLVQPSLSPEGNTDIYGGVNFASAGAGILNRTGDVLGVKISQWQQIELFLERRKSLVESLGERAAAIYLRHSLYYLGIGGNDFIHNYITNDTDDALLPPDAFTDLLLSTLKLQLQTMFDAGARKIVVLGTGPVGCLPHFLFISNSTSGECVMALNDLISAYNTRLASTVHEFNQQNHGSHVIYRDIFNIVEQMSKRPIPFGFTNGSTACCGVGMYGGADRCLSPSMVCNRPGDFVWWDLYHPSHKASHYIASQIWQGTDLPILWTDPSVPGSRPQNITFMNIRELVDLDVDSDSI